jgi:hypothetical protein
MCWLCDQGKAQDHTGSASTPEDRSEAPKASKLGRRDFLKASVASGAAAAGMGSSIRAPPQRTTTTTTTTGRRGTAASRAGATSSGAAP